MEPHLKRPTSVEALQAVLARFISDESLRRGLAFKPGPSDVIIATYPKCGTTWLQQMVHALRSRGSMEFGEITEVVPWIELAFDLGIDLALAPSPLPAYKSHLDWHDVPKGGRYITVFRDPGDALVSLYRFFEGWWFESGAISIDAFTESHFLQRTGHRRYWPYVLSWWEQRDNDRVLLLCYEDMQRDIQGTIRRVADFIGISLDDALKEIVRERSSFEFMRTHVGHFDDHFVRGKRDAVCGLPVGGDSSKVRAARVGAHRIELSARSIAKLDAAWRNEITETTGFADYATLRDAVAAASRRIA